VNQDLAEAIAGNLNRRPCIERAFEQVAASDHFADEHDFRIIPAVMPQ
jgi:hypothetical protein